jgi:hypothetical protein
MELLLGAAENRIEVATGATLEVDSVAVAAQVVAEVRAVAGGTFNLDMSLPTGWTVESLRTEPSEALYDYDVIPRGQQPQLVRMRLSTGVVPQQTTPLRILLRAHRRLPAQGAALSIEQIRLAEFAGVNVVRRLIAVPAAQFQLSGDVHVERLDPLAMPDDDARLVSGGADRIVLVDDRRARALRLSLVTERPRFTADVEITARVDAAALVEDYRLQIRPQATPVGRLLVHFSRLREETLQWTLSGNSNLAVLAQKVSLDDEPTPGMAGGETWEITLQRPRSVPFELRATRRSSGKGKRRISLASAPQAETQSGTVTIDSSAGAGVEIDGDGLRAVPADTRAMDRLNDTRAVFRYEPSQEASLDVAPAAAADSQPSLWAWVCRLTTYCGAGGVAHTATYQLETAGVRQLEVVLPDGCDLQQVLVDGREVRTTAAADDPQRFSVALPPEQRYPTLDIVFRESDATLPALVGRLEPRLPQLIDVPLLQRQWIVWTPPGYGAVELSESEPPFVAEILGQRLFGSLWRSAGQPFQLFSEDDWASLTTNAAPQAESQQAAQRCLNTLASLMGEGRSVSPGMRWGQLLTAYQAAAPADGPLPRLRIDALALAVAGVGPQTLLPTAPATASKDGGAAQVVWMLESSNLVLLTSSEEALLTTIAAARESRVLHASSPAGVRRAGVVLLDGLHQFEQVRHLSPGVFPAPEIWAAASIDELTPWKASNVQPFAAVSSCAATMTSTARSPVGR